MQKKYLTKKDVATQLEMSVGWVDTQIKKGNLIPIRMGAKVRFTQDIVNNFEKSFYDNSLTNQKPNPLFKPSVSQTPNTNGISVATWLTKNLSQELSKMLRGNKPAYNNLNFQIRNHIKFNDAFVGTDTFDKDTVNIYNSKILDIIMGDLVDFWPNNKN
jgi:hypothetical protein